MNVNRRTGLLLIAVLIVIIGVYAITQVQRARETGGLLQALHSTDHGKAMKAMAALRDRGKSIEGQLVANMQSGNDQVRWRSAVLLASVNTAGSRTALRDALADTYDDVRMDAALALGKLGDKGAADSLALMASNPDEAVPVRTAAVRALTLLRSGPHLPELAELANARPPVYPEGEEPEELPADETLLLRQTAVMGIGVLGVAADDEVASRTMNSANRGAPTAAGAAMQVLSESASMDLEPDAEVRATACAAIGDLADGVGTEEMAGQALKRLIRCLDDDADVVRIAAIHALKQVSPPDAMIGQVDAAMQKAAADDQYWVRDAVGSLEG